MDENWGDRIDKLRDERVLILADYNVAVNLLRQTVLKSCQLHDRIAQAETNFAARRRAALQSWIEAETSPVH